MNNTLVLTKPEEINDYRLLALKGALMMELIGLKRRGASAYSIIKKEFGFSGNKQSVYDQYVTHLKAIKILI